MGFFNKAATATSSGPKSRVINNLYGEFYALVNNCKISESAKGIFAITEYTPIQLIGDGDFEVGERLCTMMKFDENHTMMEQYVAEHVAAFHGKVPGHKFSDDEDENTAKWEELIEEAYGKRGLAEDGQSFEFKGDNPWQGAVLHIKSIKDHQNGRKDKDKARDAQGNVRVFTKVLVLESVAPDQLSAEVVEKFGDKLHPAYQAALGIG